MADRRHDELTARFHDCSHEDDFSWLDKRVVTLEEKVYTTNGHSLEGRMSAAESTIVEYKEVLPQLRDYLVAQKAISEKKNSDWWKTGWGSVLLATFITTGFEVLRHFMGWK